MMKRECAVSSAWWWEATLRSSWPTVPITPSSPDEIAELISSPAQRQPLQSTLAQTQLVSSLSPAGSIALLERLAAIADNEPSLRALSRRFKPEIFSNAVALQDDAIETALKVFGLQRVASPGKIIMPPDSDSMLHLRLMEDSIIEHDARSVPGMTLVASSLTGYAEFEGGGDRLRIYTANRRPLEKLFGVDLIYLNIEKRNMVLVQYKMLEPVERGESRDWIYRPDKQFKKEILRMEKFRKKGNRRDYRLNPEAFYLKFVKRDASTDSNSIIMPLDHFQSLSKKTKDSQAVSISYAALNGQYLRESGLISLIQCGYIGAESALTDAFEKLIAAIVQSGNAAVAAIQERIA
jgi:hypothetical protein